MVNNVANHASHALVVQGVNDVALALCAVADAGRPDGATAKL